MTTKYSIAAVGFLMVTAGFLAPKGTALLSLNKPVTSSDKEPVIGEIPFVTDGQKSGEDGYFVELGPGKQWVQIDLGKWSNGNTSNDMNHYVEIEVYGLPSK